MANALYSIRNLSVEYATRRGVVDAVNDVSLDIRPGEVLGLVGESGCGKSTLGMALMRLIRPPGRITSGELWFDGKDLMTFSKRQMRNLRGKRIGMIFQDPMTSLNPVQRIVDHLTEAILAHGVEFSKATARERSEALVDRLGIRKERIDDYPHQLSGGMRQRVMISLALALQADLIIADEATTSLDVIVEAQFLDLLRELRDEFNLTIILVTHNIGVVAELADRVAVMYAGRLAEVGSVYDIFARPMHPYTYGLLQSVPSIQLGEKDQLYKMPGEPPSLMSPPTGCRYHPRCPEVMEICSSITPDFVNHSEKQFAACWLYEDHPEKAIASLNGSKYAQ
ncbi:MAG: ABC transporter ATP-binding protein [Anaerolineales bacterium]